MKTLLALMLTLSFGAFAGESMSVKCDKQFDGISTKDISSSTTESESTNTTRQ